MKEFRFNIPALLLCVTALSGCSTDVEEEYPVQAQPGQEWKAMAVATKDSIAVADEEEGTRALFYGGNSRRFVNLWDQGDQVTVYKNNVSVGTMAPTTYGVLTANLAGTLTGDFAVNDVLDIYLPEAAMDFRGQKGTIYDLSQHFAFQHATANVLEASNKLMSLSNVNPSHRQEYLRFVLTNEDGTQRLHPKWLELHAVSGGHIVESMAADGTITPCDVLTIAPEIEDGEYPEQLLVSLLNDVNADVTYRLKAQVGDDIYVGPVAIEGQGAFIHNSRPYLGKLNRVLRKMRLTTPASSLNVAAIPNQVFTGSAIVPAPVVKDGETTLAQGTDYSVAATNNVNVGTATLTVTGLAMSGDRAETKYLGDKDVTFTIVKATPVVVLDNSDVNLILGGASATRTVSRVFIDNNGNGLWDQGVDCDITSQCTVTYQSSNSHATVNSSTGEVQPAGQGSAVITATVVAAGNWTAATAQYTVNVQNSTGGTLGDYDNPDDGEWGGNN